MSIDWNAVGSVSTALTLMVGVGTLIWQIRTHNSNLKHERSRFALESALDAYEQGLALLEDGNNDRVTWVTAARVLERANEITTAITSPVHSAVIEIQRERYRIRASAILGFENPEKNASFFKGERCSQDSQESSHPSQYHRLSELAESSLDTVYKLASYPHEYEDPLPRVSFQSPIGIEMRASFPGLFDFLASKQSRGTKNAA